MNELMVLKFCLKILDRRIAEKHSNLWLWKIKKKIAKFCISLMTRDSHSITDESPLLSDCEKEFIVSTHPLLDTSSASSKEMLFRRHAEWFAAIRMKINVFLHKPEEYFSGDDEPTPGP